MLQAVDLRTDSSNEELARLVRLYAVPDFVKQASLTELKQPPRGAVSCFADPRNHLYSCHSAPSTWLSALYFTEKRGEFHPKDQAQIAQRLEHYIDYFGIRPHYEALLKRAAELQCGTELPDSAYAYVWVGEDGQKERHLPLSNAAETKQAADWLLQYRDQLPYQDRHVIATKILQKAAQFGAAIAEDRTEFLEKQAGRGVCDPAEVAWAIRQRATMADPGGFRDGITKLAETVSSKPRIALQPAQLVKLAETLEGIDRTLGIRQYGGVLRRPEDVVFSATFTKIASARASVCALTTGTVYSHDQFEKLSRADVEAAFGPEFAGEVSKGFEVDGVKMATLAATLPRPDAAMLDQMMGDAGLSPQMTKAAGDGMSNEELEALAADYARVV